MMDDVGADDGHDHGDDGHGHKHGDNHGHEHGKGCKHGHGHECNHHQANHHDGLEDAGGGASEREPEVKRVAAPKTKGFANRFRVLKENTISRFKHGIDPTHMVIDEHGHNKPFEFKTPHKTGAIIGAVASLGVMVHGGVNVIRGARGYEDSMGEKHESSIRTLLVGVGEVIGGASLFTRALSGRWMP